uniref:Apolipoprotein Eb-like n=1 Tax=Gouania willdenowi TaxID=441366 RepID=A0A8C5ELB8_GOUWI
MKSAVLVLALAVITGCNARAVRQASPVPNPWEETVDRFWQTVTNLNQKADGVIQDLKASQLSRELDTLITDTMAELTVYKDDIQTKLTPFTEASVGKLSQDLTLLFEKLRRDMVDAKDRNVVYLGELKSMLEHNSDDVHGRITTYSNKLRKLQQMLQSRTSQNLHNVREGVEPYVKQAGDTASQKFTDISTILKNQAEGLGQQLETQAEGIKTQLESTAEEIRTSLEGKIDELTGLISPYATQIREQLETIVEKVKDSIPSS